MDLLLIVMCGDDTLHSAVTEGCVWGGGIVLPIGAIDGT